MKNYIFTLATALLIITGCTQQTPATKNQNDNRNDNLSCVTEPGKAIYPGTEKCCGDLNPIFGSQSENGSCWCTEKENTCGGAPICAPCGNGKCENEYKEDKCNCPGDCK